MACWAEEASATEFEVVDSDSDTENHQSNSNFSASASDEEQNNKTSPPSLDVELPHMSVPKQWNVKQVEQHEI